MPSTSIDADAVKPSAAGSSRTRDRIRASCPASGVASMPASRAATRWLGRRPWSERNRRISVTSRIIEAISASAARSANANAGQAATITVSSPVSAVHSSSVTNGMTGCSSRINCSSTKPSTCRVVSAAASSEEASGTLASSRYQSQTSSQAKW